MGAGGTRTLAAELNNQGTVTVAGPLVLARASAAHVNSGTIAVTGASNLTVTQTGAGASFTNLGAIPLGTSRFLTVTGGTLDLTAGTVSGYAGTLSTAGTTLLLTTPAPARTRLALATTTMPGAFTIPAGDSLRLVTGTFAAPTLVNDGTLVVEDAVTVTSTLTTGAGSTLLVRGSTAYGAGTLTVPTGFTNTGTIDLTSVGIGYTAQLTVTAGTLVNASTGTLLASVGAGGTRTLAAPVTSSGALTVASGASLTITGLLQLLDGSVTTASGTLTKSGGCTQSGSITLIGTSCP